jgi:hypothetical protein
MQQLTFLPNGTFLSSFFVRKEGILGIQRYSKILGRFVEGMNVYTNFAGILAGGLSE